MDRKFLLDKTEGKIMGVSAGMADFLDFDVTLIRLGWVAAFFLTGGTALLAYLITGLVAPAR